MLQTDDFFVAAFYGIEKTPTASLAAYRAFVDWFAAVNLVIDKVGVRGEGFSGKQAAFNRVKRRIEADAFETITSIELTALATSGAHPGFDFDAKAILSSRMNDALLAVDVQFMAGQELPFTNTLVQIATSLRPAYGIAYWRPRTLGPVEYAQGLLTSNPLFPIPEEERLRIARWLDVGQPEEVYRQGLLRDVYPWNFLSETQLSRKVDGVSLRRWIAKSASHGTLKEFAKGLSLWTVEEKRRQAIFDELWSASAIFNWRDFL